MPLLIGADPELFLKKNGKFHSAHGIIPGTKRRPHKVEHGAVQVDGLALEVNIDPARSPEEFVYNLSSVLSSLRRMVPEDMEFDYSATAMFDVEHMISQPQEALELGCEPDYNAYSMDINPRPDQHPIMRSAGGHFHFGWTKGALPLEDEHFSRCGTVIRQMDYGLGLVSTIYDKDDKRKQLYGAAGAFRPKRYGCEYRSASNWWLQDPKYMILMYENAHLMWNWLESGQRLEEQYGDEAQKIINSNDADRAVELCEEIGIPISLQ